MKGRWASPIPLQEEENNDRDEERIFEEECWLLNGRFKFN